MAQGISLSLVRMTTESKADRLGPMDQQNFEKLFKDYFAALMAFSRKILGDEDDAREVVHQVFINLWERRDSIDLSTSMKSYLFTAVNNRSLNRTQKKVKNWISAGSYGLIFSMFPRSPACSCR